MKKQGILVVCVLFTIGLGGTAAFAADAQVALNVSLSNPYLVADETQNVYLKVGLTGFELDSRADRPSANVSIVLDRSGSMEGEKLMRAKEAALLALDLLEARDIVSFITYSDTVSVLVPATRISERNLIRRRIESIFADGSTALFAGVSKGADEVSKFLEKNKVNRVILISDGIANVGPDTPMALGHLGESLKRTGISVTTIGLGLGYNEDLMVALAEKSDGNHAFVENSRDLARIFQYEFQDILSVVAQDVEIEIMCDEGVTPKRILGRDAEIIGNKIYTNMNQLYSNQEKYLLVELEVSPFREGVQTRVASVHVNYSNMGTLRTDDISSQAVVSFTGSREVVDSSKDRETLIDAVKQIATERSEEAITLRDKGRVDEAQQLLEENSAYLMREAEELTSPELEGLGYSNSADAAAIEDDAEWNSNRKRMKKESYEVQNQQSY